MVEAAIRLMRRSGLSGAGINEIVRESGSPKGSVYHFFPGGKRQIATEALAAYAGRVLAFMEAALSRGRSPPEKVRALFRAFARRLEEGDYCRSCPAGTVTLDLGADEEAIRLVIAAMFGEWTQAIAKHFDLGGERRARSFAGLVLTAIEGGYIRGRAERSGAAFLEAGEWLAGIAGGAAGRGRRVPTSRSAPSRSSRARRAR